MDSGATSYMTKYNNAMWDGYQMVFGDGDGVVFASGKFTGIIDVIGHFETNGRTETPPGETAEASESTSEAPPMDYYFDHLKENIAAAPSPF